MFKLNEIKELIKLVDQSSLQELEIQEENSRIFIRKPSRTESVVVTTPIHPSYLAAVPQATMQEISPPATSVPVEDTNKAEAPKKPLHT
ncbi:MAG: acetyl-CoA carboxylase biotin carboxyl carrier protein, partial [Gorillibacterium sp.]|nr:acetyl-CoA carboxylase biotin carboxyl carrier protein [Gorillibacterium sp.]